MFYQNLGFEYRRRRIGRNKNRKKRVSQTYDIECIQPNVCRTNGLHFNLAEIENVEPIVAIEHGFPVSIFY